LVICLAIAITFGLFKAATHSNRQISDPGPRIEQALAEGESHFQTYQEELINDATRLREEIRESIEREENRYLIFQAMSNYEFWGAVLYRNNSPWSWSGFHIIVPPPFEPDGESDIETVIHRRNNITLLVAQSIFSYNGQLYHLITARKLSQSTNLPIAGEVNFDLANSPDFHPAFPVNFSFSKLPPNQLSQNYKTLATTQNDSVGIVYAQETDYEAYRAEQKANIEQNQRLFQLLLFLSLFALFTVFIISYQDRRSLLIQITLLPIAWYLATHVSISDIGLRYFLSTGFEQSPDVYRYLGEYLLNSCFLLLASIPVMNSLKERRISEAGQTQLKSAFLALCYGAVQVLLILYFVLSTKQLTTDSAIPLLDLQLLPPVPTLLFYISAALFFAGISGISIAASCLLFSIDREKAVIIFLSSFFSLLIFSFGIDQLTDLELFIGWQFLLIFSLHALFLGTGWLITRYPENYNTMSGFRRMLILLLMASSSIYIIIWNTTSVRINQELLHVAEEYSDESDSDGERILESVLQTLEQRTQQISQQDIFGNPERAAARFEQTVESVLQGKWQNYVMDFHLLRADGTMISDYSTSIDSPGWATVFDIDFMIRSHRGEQLRMETNRPIIWDRPMDIGEDYRSFYRGWIPVYSVQNNRRIIAWITGLIYQERPDFNKPIRAVMAAATDEEWRKSFYMAEFTGNRMIRSATKGIYTDQPEYNRLSDIERSIAMEDSLAFITTQTAQGSFREVLLKVGERNIVKVSTPKKGSSNHLFSFFRLFLPLLYFGLFVMGIASVCGFRTFNLFSQTNRFQQRLIDGFALATLLFLTVLIFATQFAISNQSEKNIERDLVNKLKNLSESILLASPSMDRNSTEVPLSAITTALNVDAMLYKNVWVSESTTPQMFQQHLIPRILPFNAYEFIYNRERRHILSTVQIGDETLLVGYRATVDDNNQPVGVIAIPTFTESPIYTEQLLETTSYLFVIYLAIFFLFTVGALMFSNQLTKPLELIQKGLSKISRGEEKTRIPVTSSDEVGSLARAYNQMVDKLDEAQKELIRAERESAWKEMAQQVAHEIKNPLTPMKLNLQHLQRQLEANPENVMQLKPVIETTAANIIEQIESLNKIASDFSKFSKPIREPFEPTNIKPLIESVSELYNSDENIVVNVELPSPAMVANCVEDEIRRVLINLVKNGVEAADGRASVITIKGGISGDQIYIQVTDNGAGIPPGNQDNIFVPNFSTKSSGTGLGLAISKKIIEAHNGDITFETVPGSGTTFRITLPRS
jgi:signal transduction histidine kinase